MTDLAIEMATNTFSELCLFAPYPPIDVVNRFNAASDAIPPTDEAHTTFIGHCVLLAIHKLRAQAPPGTPAEQIGVALIPLKVDDNDGQAEQIDPALFPDQISLAVARGVTAAVAVPDNDAALSTFSEFLAGPNGDRYPLIDIEVAVINFVLHVYGVELAGGTCACIACGGGQ